MDIVLESTAAANISRAGSSRLLSLDVFRGIYLRSSFILNAIEAKATLAGGLSFLGHSLGNESSVVPSVRLTKSCAEIY